MHERAFVEHGGGGNVADHQATAAGRPRQREKPASRLCRPTTQGGNTNAEQHNQDSVGRQLEHQFERELNDAGIASGGDGAEVGRSEDRIRCAKLSGIQEIEQLSP